MSTKGCFIFKCECLKRMLEVKFLITDHLVGFIETLFLIYGTALRLTFKQKRKKKVHMSVLFERKLLSKVYIMGGGGGRRMVRKEMAHSEKKSDSESPSCDLQVML